MSTVDPDGIGHYLPAEPPPPDPWRDWRELNASYKQMLAELGADDQRVRTAKRLADQAFGVLLRNYEDVSA